MTSLESSPKALQRAYYERTATQYRDIHEDETSAHTRALDTALSLLRQTEATSLLDVGAGAGRAVRFLAERRPDLLLRGVEPVPALIEEAERAGLPAGLIAQGSGEALPFPDASFDVVTSFGILHHVPKPALVIGEMLRVAKKAVLISDSNRFGQGRPIARYAKLAIHALGLWPTFDFVRSRGRGYFVSEGDGVFYSYSVFDSLPQLRAWAPQLTLVELESAPQVAGRWAGPLCNASTLLVAAVKPR